jgi:hypothetical protein
MKERRDIGMGWSACGSQNVVEIQRIEFYRPDFCLPTLLVRDSLRKDGQMQVRLRSGQHEKHGEGEGSVL